MVSAVRNIETQNQDAVNAETGILGFSDEKESTQ
jgi:hypothetical protein